VLIIAGDIVNGLAISLIFVPLLGEIIDAVKEKERLTEDNNDLSDLASGLFNFSYAIGCMIAPIIGGLFYQIWGFRKTCDIMAFSCIVFSIFYFLLNMLPYLMKK
jgi:MFS family permease